MNIPTNDMAQLVVLLKGLQDGSLGVKEAIYTLEPVVTKLQDQYKKNHGI